MQRFLQELRAKYGLKLIGAVLIILVGKVVAKTIRKLVERAMGRTKTDPMLVSFAEDSWDVCFDTLENVKARLGAAGISIAFPQQDVHLYKHE